MYSIYKITIGRYYYIAKTTNIEWLLNGEFDKQLKNYNDGKGIKNVLYYPLINALIQNSFKKSPSNYEYELLYTDPSGYKVLKEELSLLRKHYGKKYCLNQNSTPHIPNTNVTNPTGHTFLTQSEYMNFQKLLNKGAKVVKTSKK